MGCQCECSVILMEYNAWIGVIIQCLHNQQDFEGECCTTHKWPHFTYNIPFRLQAPPSRRSEVLVDFCKAQGNDDGKLSCPKSLANYDNAQWAPRGSCSRSQIYSSLLFEKCPLFIMHEVWYIVPHGSSKERPAKSIKFHSGVKWDPEIWAVCRESWQKGRSWIKR